MSWYFRPYFIVNYLLCSIYFIFKYCSNNIENPRENHVIMSFLTIILLRFFKYFTSAQMFVYDTLFYIKLINFFLFFFVEYKYAIWYAVILIISYILIEIPRYNGKTNILPINTQHEFNSLILNNIKKNTYSFVVFHSHLSSKCIFTEEIWASMSLKYTHERLKFYSVDIDNCNEICLSQNINTKGSYIEIPILILYKNGSEEKRFPMVDKNGKTYQALKYSKKGLISFFDLETIHSEVLKSK